MLWTPRDMSSARSRSLCTSIWYLYPHPSSLQACPPLPYSQPSDFFFTFREKGRFPSSNNYTSTRYLIPLIAVLRTLSFLASKESSCLCLLMNHLASHNF